MQAACRYGEGRQPVIAPAGHRYGAILADPPWRFETWSAKGRGRSADRHYPVMDLAASRPCPSASWRRAGCRALPVVIWTMLPCALEVIAAWGFRYKTCGFDWMKADPAQHPVVVPSMGCGFWSRANTEPCLLATRGHPKRLHADVRQAILTPRRDHSRKPACVHERIERLVAGPYLELFARERRAGWDAWGDEV